MQCQSYSSAGEQRKHVFGSEGRIAGMGWQTYALSVGVSYHLSLIFTHHLALCFCLGGLRTTSYIFTFFPLIHPILEYKNTFMNFIISQNYKIFTICFDVLL